jgi:hypothetical protein
MSEKAVQHLFTNNNLKIKFFKKLASITDEDEFHSVLAGLNKKIKNIDESLKIAFTNDYNQYIESNFSAHYVP